MLLNKEEILFILQLIRDKYGPGYSDELKVGTLQAKLSILLEVESKKEAARDGQG